MAVVSRRIMTANDGYEMAMVAAAVTGMWRDSDGRGGEVGPPFVIPCLTRNPVKHARCKPHYTAVRLCPATRDGWLTGFQLSLE
ncbi:hypothetical protein [Candidatus Spongiihabitans sp.]|uniref:hypothetical protein n=1 Tax=Candidatus Spongiihabitans sp. TaxID=3101308 RepID=UPI003C7A8D20